MLSLLYLSDQDYHSSKKRQRCWLYCITFRYTIPKRYYYSTTKKMEIKLSENVPAGVLMFAIIYIIWCLLAVKGYAFLISKMVFTRPLRTFCFPSNFLLRLNLLVMHHFISLCLSQMFNLITWNFGIVSLMSSEIVYKC